MNHKLTNWGKAFATFILIVIFWKAVAEPALKPRPVPYRPRYERLIFTPNSSDTRSMAERLKLYHTYYINRGWTLDREITVIENGASTHLLIFKR